MGYAGKIRTKKTCRNCEHLFYKLPKIYCKLNCELEMTWEGIKIIRVKPAYSLECNNKRWVHNYETLNKTTKWSK